MNPPGTPAAWPWLAALPFLLSVLLNLAESAAVYLDDGELHRRKSAGERRAVTVAALARAPRPYRARGSDRLGGGLAISAPEDGGSRAAGFPARVGRSRGLEPALLFIRGCRAPPSGRIFSRCLRLFTGWASAPRLYCGFPAALSDRRPLGTAGASGGKESQRTAPFGDRRGDPDAGR